jgi:hypothetical protein
VFGHNSPMSAGTATFEVVAEVVVFHVDGDWKSRARLTPEGKRR